MARTVQSSIYTIYTATGGQAVTLSTHTTADGSYTFENLAPGDYKIKQIQPVFLVDAP